MNIQITHEITNNSEQFILVGNCSTIISVHANLADAKKALAKVDENSMKWADVQIVAPHQTMVSHYINDTSAFVEPAPQHLSDLFEN